jgi:hypothetical protein
VTCASTMKGYSLVLLVLPPPSHKHSRELLIRMRYNIIIRYCSYIDIGYKQQHISAAMRTTYICAMLSAVVANILYNMNISRASD